MPGITAPAALSVFSDSSPVILIDWADAEPERRPPDVLCRSTSLDDALCHCQTRLSDHCCCWRRLQALCTPSAAADHPETTRYDPTCDRHCRSLSISAELHRSQPKLADNTPPLEPRVSQLWQNVDHMTGVCRLWICLRESGCGPYLCNERCWLKSVRDRPWHPVINRAFVLNYFMLLLNKVFLWRLCL